jgi:hypothetical protein
MGRLVYNESHEVYELDDRILWPLRAVISDKLRRDEAFMLTIPMPAGNGFRSVWIGPSVPLVFHTAASRIPPMSRELLAELMSGANDPDGLDLRPFFRRVTRG